MRSSGCAHGSLHHIDELCMIGIEQDILSSSFKIHILLWQNNNTGGSQRNDRLSPVYYPHCHRICGVIPGSCNYTDIMCHLQTFTK